MTEKSEAKANTPKVAEAAPSALVRKLRIIVGEAQGDGSRSLRRLEAMLPKLGGSKVPGDVQAFLDAHKKG